MPLSMLPVGEQRVIQEICAKDKTCRFLGHIGFTKGCAVHMIQKDRSTLVVHVENHRVPISLSIANCIMV